MSFVHFQPTTPPPHVEGLPPHVKPAVRGASPIKFPVPSRE